MLVAGKKPVLRCKLFLFYKNPLMSVKYYLRVFLRTQLILELLAPDADYGVNRCQLPIFYLYHSVIQSFGMFFKLHSHSEIQFVVSESTERLCFKIISILNNLLCLFQVFCNLSSCKIDTCQKPEKKISQ